MSRKKRNPFEREPLCERFMEALTCLGLSPATAYESLGYRTSSTLYSIAAGRCLPDLIKLIELSKLKTAGGYRINLDWLITGKGQVLLPEHKKSSTTKKVEDILIYSTQKKIKAISTLLS